MSWADFYLVCFVVGFFLSLVMFLGGGMHLHVPAFPFSLAGGALPRRRTCRARGRCARHANFAVQSDYTDGVSGVVWRHGIFADAAFGDLVLGSAGDIAFERHRRRGNHLFVYEPGAEFRGRSAGSGGLRNGRRAGQIVDSDSRGRYRGVDLLAGGNAAGLRGTHGRCVSDFEGDGSCGHAL